MREADFRAYIDACSRHDWPTVRTYFADEVVVDGLQMPSDDFVSKLVAKAAADPAFRWSIVACHRDDDTITASLLVEGAKRYGTEIWRYAVDGLTIAALTMV